MKLYKKEREIMIQVRLRYWQQTRVSCSVTEQSCDLAYELPVLVISITFLWHTEFCKQNKFNEENRNY